MIRRTTVLHTILLATASFAVATLPASAQSRPGAQDAPERSARHDFRIATVADGLVVPWGMAFLPDGGLLVTERPGRLRVVRDGQLVPAPVEGVPAVRAEGQGGLLDVVLHPRFAENRFVYLSCSKPNADGTQSTTAVVRGRFDGTRLTDVETIVEAKAWSDGLAHYGSRLAFDRDGFLFVTVGDRQVYPSDLEGHPAQDLTTHHGKVLRLHDDGRVPADNPYVGRADALPEIWSTGHRNQQGLTIDPVTNEVWATEHGPQGGDELNRIERGKNYGWPVVGFGVMYRTGAAIHPGTLREGMEPPVHVWVPSIAASGLMRYDGVAFPEWRGNLFAGGLSGQQLVRLTLAEGRVVNVEQLVQGRGRIRDVRQGPDGYVYVAFEDRSGTPTRLVRLEPANR